MSKFKVGDRVKCIKKCDCEFWGALNSCEQILYTIGDVIKMMEEGRYIVKFPLISCCRFEEKQLVLTKEAQMSKYDELKQRIEALQNGWDKEADDIVNELVSKCSEWYGILPYSSNIHGYIEILNNNRQEITLFSYNTQCEKLSAFKQALLWLLDHSDIKKDEKQQEIEAIREQMKALQERLDKLER